MRGYRNRAADRGIIGPVMRVRDVRQTVCDRLKSLPGVFAAVPLEDADRSKVLEMESRYERQALIPLRNLGLREVLGRGEVVVLLKDHHFREPPGPTLYLVEDGAPTDGAPCVAAGGGRYRIIGEERFPSSPPIREKTLSLSSTFVLFPGRRSSAATPTFFLLPALPFPELEGEGAPGGALRPSGIRRVASISPSTAVDIFLRERCRLPPDGSLATLLVGFDLADPAEGGTP